MLDSLSSLFPDTGTLQRGCIKKGDNLVAAGFGERLPVTVTDIQVFKKSLPQCIAGDHVGLLVRGARKEQLLRGMCLARPDNAAEALRNEFEATIYMLKASEGGSDRPLLPNAHLNAFCNMWNAPSIVRFGPPTPEATKTRDKTASPKGRDKSSAQQQQAATAAAASPSGAMLMPGEATTARILINKPHFVEKGFQFSMRNLATQKTVLTGLVTNVLPVNQVQIPGFNFMPPKPVRVERPDEKRKESSQPSASAKKKK